MSIIVWTDALSVGNEGLDEDHRQLVALIDMVSEAGPTFGTVFSRLLDYVADHFEREERYMEAIGYPDLDRHRALHDAFSARVSVMLKQHNDDLFSRTDESVADFLWTWLRTHIQVEDKKYATWAVASRREG